jgi:hypothetical protein
MITDRQICEPFLFNPIKHHLGFIREFINLRAAWVTENDLKNLTRELKHLGTSVTDVYNGALSISDICEEAQAFLTRNAIVQKDIFSTWVGTNMNDFKVIAFQDLSQWTLKYRNNVERYVHIFPARNSPHSFRVKSNTLKTAILYCIMIGKDFISADNLNKIRPLLGLSPIKDSVDSEAITEMIEILRG